MRRKLYFTWPFCTRRNGVDAAWGIDPLNIIKISTHNGAKMLGIFNEYGTIEKGKYADMVLLNKNPFKDIKNTLSIDKIIKAGVLKKRINNEIQ